MRKFEVVIGDEVRSIETEVGDSIILGSGSHCDVVIAQQSVGETHAAVDHREDGLYVRDLGSPTGTYHGPARVSANPVKLTETVHIGSPTAAQLVTRSISGAQAGWYRDPWGRAHWRWWDGSAWSSHTNSSQPAVSIPAQTQEDIESPRKPRLPGWLSLPVVLAAPVSLLATALPVVIFAPLAAVLGLVPLLFVVPVVLWADRIEPEPREAKLHALLWGATVAIAISVVVNGIARAGAGGIFTTVISAPVIEEVTKGALLVVAVRRSQLDGILDGVVYAFLVGVGFAVVENFVYLANAMSEGRLVLTFVLRALLSPFAHPLFTTWTGLGVGFAMSRGLSVYRFGGLGLLVAVFSHFLWNATTVVIGDVGLIALVVPAAFVMVFVSLLVALHRLRSSERDNYLRHATRIAARHGVEPKMCTALGDLVEIRATRKRLKNDEKRHLDDLKAAVARLAMLESRQAVPATDVKARLVEQVVRSDLALRQ